MNQDAPHPSTDEKIVHAADDPNASQTDWSMILRAAHGDEKPAAEAWEQLCRRYWPAIYAYVRHSGRDIHEAADLTQGFVCDVMVGRELLASASPDRGRFRTLLLTALKNYLIQQHRHATRQKRAPMGRKVLEWDEQEPSVISLTSDAPPDQAFAAQWSATLVRRVLEQVRGVCEAEGLTAHWAVFESRVVKPLLGGEEPVSYATLVEIHGLRDPAQAANMMVTVKRRFARALATEIGGTVADPCAVTDEMRSLLRMLEQPA
jgi:RNA polymerase sigma-70 factor (ECF subfamily)